MWKNRLSKPGNRRYTCAAGRRRVRKRTRGAGGPKVGLLQRLGVFVSPLRKMGHGHFRLFGEERNDARQAIQLLRIAIVVQGEDQIAARLAHHAVPRGDRTLPCLVHDQFRVRQCRFHELRCAVRATVGGDQDFIGLRGKLSQYCDVRFRSSTRFRVVIMIETFISRRARPNSPPKSKELVRVVLRKTLGAGHFGRRDNCSTRPSSLMDWSPSRDLCNFTLPDARIPVVLSPGTSGMTITFPPRADTNSAPAICSTR